MASSAASETANLADSFNKAAATYERRMGTATRTVARHIIHQNSQLPAKPILCDNACGTGAVTKAFLDAHPDGSVIALDKSKGMIDLIEQNVQENHWAGRVDAKVVDSVRLDLPADKVDLHVMNFGIFFTSDAQAAADEIYRTTKLGGRAVVTCWKESALFSIIFQVQDILKPAAPLTSISFLEKWRDASTLSECMSKAGFQDIQMDQFPVNLTAPSLDLLVESVAENLRGMAGEQWTEQDNTQLYPATKQVLLADGAKHLSVKTDSCYAISWVAWIATGRKA